MPFNCTIGMPRIGFCHESLSQKSWFCFGPAMAASILFICAAFPPTLYTVLVTNFLYIKKVCVWEECRSGLLDWGRLEELCVCVYVRMGANGCAQVCVGGGHYVHA